MKAGAERPPAHDPSAADFIDPEDARDHDDAVWVERAQIAGGPGYRAWIAIADVSTYVTPKTMLDDEAKARGLQRVPA